MNTQRTASQSPDILPRGIKTLLPHGSLPEVMSLHLINLIKKTGGKTGPIGLQFVAQPELESQHYSEIGADPLNEDQHEVAPGLVYKYRGKLKKDGAVAYHGRALWTITRYCASYCRFCTRGREVGIPSYMKGMSTVKLAQKPHLSDDEIAEVFAFLKKHKEINEVILSGGDPLTTPRSYFTRVIEGLVALQKRGDIHIIRIGSRAPIHNPITIKEWHYELLAQLKNPYLMLHHNHPAELTPETIEVLNNLRTRSQMRIMGQSVLLKGVNDSVDTLYELFTNMVIEGIQPYYLLQNDPVYWARHFTVPIKRAIQIWKQLRPRLSGVAATARLVIDVPQGYGKVPLPEGDAWDVDYSYYRDFKKKKHHIEWDGKEDTSQ